MTLDRDFSRELLDGLVTELRHEFLSSQDDLLDSITNLTNAW